MTRRLAVCVACCAALLAGCGGGGEEEGPTFPGPDPATLAPPEAPLFAEAVVRPEGDQREVLQSALSKLLATDDPGGFIAQQLDRSFAESNAGIDYEHDIRPWLGPRAAVFLDNFKENADGAFLAATTDPDATQKTLDKAAAADRQPERKRTYKGIHYLVDKDDDAGGVVGSFMVFGSERAFREAVDASRGESLADSGDFTSELDDAPSDSFGFAHGDGNGIVAALQKAGQLTPSQLASAPQLTDLLSQDIMAAATATSDQLGLDVSAASGDTSPSPEESPLLESLPADSWFAFASSDAGKGFGQVFQQLPSQAEAGLPAGVLADLAQVGDWAGDVAGYMRGTSVLGIGGALIVETADEAASAKTLDDLQRALSTDPAVRVSPLSEPGKQGFSLSPATTPIQFQFVQGDGKVVAGLGSDSVDQALSPSSKLGDSDRFDAATSGLGDYDPVAFLDFVPLFQFLDGIPQASSDPDYQRAKPYLDHLDYLALGARDESSGRTGARLVLGLRESSGTSGGAEAPPAVVEP